MTCLQNIPLKVYAKTDVGRVRSINEDNFLILDLLTGESQIAGEQENPTLSRPPAIDLIALANEYGGEDNITVVIARFDGA